MTDALSLSLAKLTGSRESLRLAKDAMDGAATRISLAQAQNATDLGAVVTALQGVVGYRQVSSVDDASNAERTAGQIAIVQAIKGGNADLSEEEAKNLWKKAALASRPEDRRWLLCDPDGLLREYEANLGLADWDAFRAWILATPIEQMGI